MIIFSHLQILIFFLALSCGVAKAGVHKTDQELFPSWLTLPLEKKCKPRFENEDTLVHLNFVSHEFNQPVDVRYNRFIFPDVQTCEDSLNSSPRLTIDGTELSCGFFAPHNGVYKYKWGIISSRGIGVGSISGLFKNKNDCESVLLNPAIANKKLWYCQDFNSSYVIATINASYFPPGSNPYPELSQFKTKSVCQEQMLILKRKCEQNPNYFRCKK